MKQLEKINVIPQEPTAAITPMEMLNRAVAQGADIEVLEKLMNLHERWEAGQARKAYENAMAAAKAEIPNISKNREVDFTSTKGRTHYRYEDLGEIVKVIAPILGKYGLSHRYRTTSNVNEPVTVTCIISHRDGHFEENTLSAGRDESGNKNSIQAIGSTSTYLQRMTLKAALGIAVSNDDDGRGAGAGVATITTITQEQADELRDIIEAKGKDRAAFLKWAKRWGAIERIEDIPADQFDACLNAANYEPQKKA